MASNTWLGTDATAPTSFTTDANWSTGAVPTAGDDLVFTSDYNNACAQSVDQGTTAFGSLYVENGYTNQIGAFGAPFISAVENFEYNGGGVIWADLGDASGIPVTITNSGAGASGAYGVNLKGNITTLSVSGGTVAVNLESGYSGTLTALRSSGGTVVLGPNLTSVTSVDMTGGVVEARKNIPTVRVMGGEFRTSGSAAITTKLSVYAGNCVLSGSGTIADLLLDSDGGSQIDFSRNGISRTVTAIKNNGGTLIYDPNVITFTTDTSPDKAVRKTITNIN
jgi:hypothetical protein